MANFWLRPENAFTSNNAVAFIESTLENLGATKVGTFRADSGFYDKAVVSLLKDHQYQVVRYKSISTDRDDTKFTGS